MLLDHPIISQRYFFPRRTKVPDAGRFEVDVGEANLHCWRLDQGSDRCFVHFHGNGEVVNDYLGDYVEAISAMGLDVLLVEYRGYGGSTGVPKMGAMLDDVSKVIDALGRPQDELIIYGRSVGSIYAIEAAKRYPNIAALILESGIADPLQRLTLRMEPSELDTTKEAMEAAADEYLDHYKKLGAYTGPLLVMHAADDDLVPLEHALLNHEWAASNNKTLTVFEHGGHNAILSTNWAAYLKAVQKIVSA